MDSRFTKRNTLYDDAKLYEPNEHLFIELSESFGHWDQSLQKVSLIVTDEVRRRIDHVEKVFCTRKGLQDWCKEASQKFHLRVCNETKIYKLGIEGIEQVDISSNLEDCTIVAIVELAISNDNKRPMLYWTLMEGLLFPKESEGTCSICMDAEISHVFVPCGHFCTCITCARLCDRCPICRVPVGSVTDWKRVSTKIFRV
jgi:hypothetical protein